jgi:hypothetical protein
MRGETLQTRAQSQAQTPALDEEACAQAWSFVLSRLPRERLAPAI